MDVFRRLLDHPKVSIVREVCWILSNICVGTASQLDQILSNLDLMQKIGELYIGGDPLVKKEISYIFGNICSKYSDTERIFAVMKNHNLLESLVQFIKNESDSKCLEGGLYALF